jgi:hypothetical protein
MNPAFDGVLFWQRLLLPAPQREECLGHINAQVLISIRSGLRIRLRGEASTRQ